MVSQGLITPRRVAEILAKKPVFRHISEITLVVLAFLCYFIVRGSVVDRASEAVNRSFQIINLERNIGFFWETELQTAILGSKLLIQLFNFIYFWMDFPFIILVGIWMYCWHRRQYTLTRDAMLLSGAIALVIYHFFPVAPPRFLPEFGFVDTMAEYSRLSYQAETAQPLVNPYAAVPSLHVGWPVILAVGVIMATRFKPIWILAVLLPVAQLFAVVSTGNHFIFDAQVGVIVALAGLGLALAMQRWGYAALGRLLGIQPKPEKAAEGAPP
jgi:hypothetical protein